MCWEIFKKEKMLVKNFFKRKSMEKLLNSVIDPPKFDLDGHESLCKVLSVYDGDTMTVAFVYKDTVYKTSIRMLGYNSPEIKTTDPIEKAAAITAKQALINMINNDFVTVKFGKNEKYGRPLASVYKGDMCLNDEMLRLGHGKSYDGRGPKEW